MSDGEAISLVAELILFCPGSHICQMVHSRLVFRTDANLDRTMMRFTILHGTKQSVGSNMWIQTSEHSRILKHSPLAVDHLKKLVETCAGLGIVGNGFHRSGIETVCYNEVNPLFCEWIRNNKSSPVIEGDLTETNTVGKVFDVVGSPHILSAGISCQPFSYMGDRKEQKDERSTSLTGTLRMAYLNQSAMVVLECTPAAQDSKWVQDVLQEFCNTTGFRMQQKVLHLDSTWPAVRNRWWAVLAHPAFQISPVQDMPSLRFQPTIMHLISKMLDPPEHIMKQIALDGFELERFSHQKGGIGRYVMNAYRPLPTATHSWGSQMTACRCGCRLGGFKQSRLDEKGLHAVLIPIGDLTKKGDDTYYGMKHILPQEVCLLNGMFPSGFKPNHESDVRLELAGVGQMASPLQSCWVIGNIMFDLYKQGLITEVPAPRHVIAKMCRDLIHDRDVVWSSQKRNKYHEIFETELRSIDHPIVFWNHEEESKDEDDFTQKLKEICPAIEAKLAKHSDVAGAEITSRKGKGGKIPPKHPVVHPSSHPLLQPKAEQVKHPVLHPSLHSSLQPEAEKIPKNCQKFGNKTNLGNRNIEEVVYPPNGGIPGFETGVSNKRHREEVDRQVVNVQTEKEEHVKKSRISRPDEQILQNNCQSVITSEESQVPDQKDEQSPMTSMTNSNQAPETCIVLTAMPMERVTEVKCNCNHTVGQFAVAEARLMDIDGPLQTTDLVGHHIPISSNIHHEQIIMLNPSLEDYQKCPRQTSSSCCPELAHLTRFDAVWHQKGWVAWDEMEFYLNTIQEEKGINACEPIDFSDDNGMDVNSPIFANSFLKQEDPNQGVYTAGWFQQHWFPIHVVCCKDVWTITIPSELQFMVQDKVTSVLEGCEVRFRGTSVPSKFGADCGFQTIAWIQNQENKEQPSFPMTPQEAIRCRLVFAESLTTSKSANCKFGDLKLGGMNEHQIRAEVMQLIESHGVQQQRSEECVNHLVRVLGLPALQSVIASGSPWKELKSRANAQTPPIQIVLASELQQAIVARTKAGLTFGSKKNKKKEMQPRKPFRIDASMIQVPPSIFQQQDGKLLEQISADQLHSKSRGIVIANADEAVPYLRIQEPICREGLGLLVLDINDDRLPPVKEIISFPATCPDTAEPIILSAVLIQLGGQTVCRHVPQDRSKVEVVPTDVIRVLAFKDEMATQWKEIVAKPVKTVLASPPCAKVAPDDIVDVWDRQFLTKNFTRCRHEDAEIFVCALRLTTQCSAEVLGNSGQHGLYFEPRSSNGRSPDDGFRVIWLPKKDIGEIKLLRQTAAHEAWIVRHGDRLGLRVREEHAKQMHEQLRPDLSYIDGKSIQSFRVGPLPFGTTKKHC